MLENWCFEDGTTLSMRDFSARMPSHEASPITLLRLRQGLTLNQLASAARIDPAHLELIERRSGFAAPHRDEIMALARALRVPVEEVQG